MGCEGQPETSDTARYATFFHALLERGITLAPSQFESGFLSSAHTDTSIEQTLEACEAAFARL